MPAKKASKAFEPFASPYVAKECVGAGFDQMFACIDAMGTSLRAFGQMNSELQENYRRIFSSEMKLSQKAATCRSPKEMLELQQKATQQWLDNYFKESQKLCTILMKNYLPPALGKACMVME